MVASGDDGHNESDAIECVTVADELPALHQRLEAADLFYGHGTDNAWDEAVQLLLACLDLPPGSGDEVLSLPLSASSQARIDAALERRLQGEPLPYVLGKAFLAGLEFKCDARALVPRSPLGEVILNDFEPWWSDVPTPRILDLCCGGGCLGIVAAVHRADATVLLADIDASALALAQDNIGLHNLANRVTSQCSDLYQQIESERFDIILCNPPYVDSADIHSMPGEYRAEPLHALAAGEDGLDLVLTILAESARWLNSGGVLFLEVGNSWEALDQLCPELALTWLEFAHGGHGVLVASADELQQWRAHFAVLAAARCAGGV